MRTGWNNNRGFSMIEVMIVLGISVFMMAAFLELAHQTNTSMHKVAAKADQDIDKSLSTRILWLAMRMVTPSYNNLSTLDDNGLGFFDYYPDLPAFSLPSGKRSRQFTLDYTARKEITFLLRDTGGKQGFVIPPLANYNYTPSRDPSVSGTVAYVGLNRSGELKAAFQELWVPNSLFLLESPIPLRPVVGGNIDMKTPPRFMSFAGTLSPALNTLLSAKSLVPDLITSSPVDPRVNITDPDVFFRNLPPAGGFASVATIIPIKAVKFSIEKSKVNSAHFDIYRTDLTGSMAGVKNMIASNVIKLRFTRSLVSMPTISYDLEYPK